MIRKAAFILFMLTVASAIGMLILDKVRHQRAVNQCVETGGRWNYMEQDCDRY